MSATITPDIAVAAIPPPTALPTFTRGVFLADGRVHVESRCKDCGYQISALSNPLDEGELAHAATCFGATY